jgi:hypothetical protein
MHRHVLVAGLPSILPAIEVISGIIRADGRGADATADPATSFYLITLVSRGLQQLQEIIARFAKRTPVPAFLGRNHQMPPTVSIVPLLSSIFYLLRLLLWYSRMVRAAIS